MSLASVISSGFTRVGVEIKAIKAAIDQMADAYGAGADYDGTSFSAPSFSVNANTYTDVQSALQDLDTRIAGLADLLKDTQSTTSTATLTPSATNDNCILTGQAAALAVAAPSGSHLYGDKILFAFKDNGTARAITWNAIYVNTGATAPLTTVVGKWVYIGAVYNEAASKWHIVAVSQEA